MSEEKAYVTSGEGFVEIGNKYIARHFSFASSVAKTEYILNKRADNIRLCPIEGSEEFVIALPRKIGKSYEIKSSQLRVDKVEIKKEENQKTIIFHYLDVQIKDEVFYIKMKLSLRDEDSYISKQIIFDTTDNDNVVIDYIDTERLRFASDVKGLFTRREGEKIFLDPYYDSLGQPVYINGLFFGNEFPLNENHVKDGYVRLRYYSGKTLTELENDGNNYVTWNTVIGAASSTEYETVKNEFLEYIKSISLPTVLRTQYNSWYDFMMDINEKNIVDTFSQIEKGLTRTGNPPLDCYAVDDGWNDYDGNFWAFNSKFPNELKPVSDLVSGFSSELGLWLGPRGGYNYNSKFAKNIEKYDKGAFNKQSYDICVADKRYVDRVSDFFIDNMNKYDIGYWKLDGFMLKPCKNKHHQHLTGGHNDMYCMTDCWEKWLKVFEKMRKFRAELNKDLWINLTCYAVPSPWLLKWVNSVWLQNSEDIGFTDKTKSGEVLGGNDVDKMLTYRDSRYYDFFSVRKNQFPCSNVYNHEPIYGNTANIKMTDDEFRRYLYMLALRGTAFWELYYSYNMLNDEKCRINKAVLRFVKENFDTLQHSRLIGDSADEGKIYGYSAWGENKGFIALRNPSNLEKVYNLKLDKSIGVPENIGELTRYVVYPHRYNSGEEKASYGSSYKLTLKPHEVFVFEFSQDKKEKAKLQYTQFIDEKTVKFCFDRDIVISPDSFEISGTVLDAKLLDDYSTVIVSLPEPIREKARIMYRVRSIYGAETSSIETVKYYKDMLITDNIALNYDITGEFTFIAKVKAQTKDTVLFYQGNDMVLKLSNGRLLLSLCTQKVNGKTDLTELGETEIAAVREANGMIKLYVNGRLDGSGYDEKLNMLTVPASLIKTGNSLINFKLVDKALEFNS